MKIKKIICVDDETEILEIFKSSLAKEGYEVSLAQNAIDCGCLLPEVQPDLIIFDIMMPQMDGIKAIKYLKAGPFKHVKLLVVTGSLEESQMEFLNDEKIPWLVKPLYGKQLIKKIKELDSV